MTVEIAGADTDTPTTCAIHATPVEQYENGHGGYTVLCRRCQAEHEAHAERQAAITALRRPPAFDRDASSVRHGYNAALADVLAILRGTTDA